MIAESSLLSNSTATWELIELPQKDLSLRSFPAVAPLNETEIAILGGCVNLVNLVNLDKSLLSDKNNPPNHFRRMDKMSDIIVFDTTTKTCRLVIASGD